MSPARVLLVDNYDSFVGNLYQYFGELGAEPLIRRNDAVTPSEVLELRVTHLVISPGPGTPDDAGVSLDVIRTLTGELPILGVCLGHQCLGQAYGGQVVRGEPVHGKTGFVHHNGMGVFAGLPDPMEATRYHSLVVDPASVPEDLEVTAWLHDGTIMGLRHRRHPTYGVQFHPESVLTREGKRLLANFLRRAAA